MEQADFCDILGKFPNTATKFLNIITAAYAKTIFNRKLLSLPEEIMSFGEFVEIDPKKLEIKPLEKVEQEKYDEDEKEFFLPLYKFPILEPVELPEDAKNTDELKQSKLSINDKDKNSFESLFLIERLVKQKIEDRAKKKSKKVLLTTQPEQKKTTRVKVPEKITEKYLETEAAQNFAEISEDLKVLEEENDIILKKIQQLQAENHQLSEEIIKESTEIDHKNVM